MSERFEIINDPKEIFETWYNDQLADDENQALGESEEEGEK